MTIAPFLNVQRSNKSARKVHKKNTDSKPPRTEIFGLNIFEVKL